MYKPLRFLLSQILISGGNVGTATSGQTLANILVFNTAQSWQGGGSMKEKRSGHAVMLLNNVSRFCS